VANHEKPFDRLSKRFAVAVSRRSILHSLSAAVAGAFLPWTKAFGQEPPKRPIGPYPKTLTGFMESPDYQTVVLEKRLLKPGSSLSDPSKLKPGTPVCNYLIEVSTAPEVSGGPAPFTKFFSCPAPEGICMPLLACKKEADRISEKGGETKAVSFDLSKNSGNTNSPLKDNCKRIDFRDANRVGGLQFLDSEQSVLEQLCTISYSCENTGVGTAVCPPNQEVIVVGGKESVKTTCPQVNDCIAAQVPRLRGYTRAELDTMPENERKQILSKLAEPPLPYKKPT
jgi:hypothetical protein